MKYFIPLGILVGVIAFVVLASNFHDDFFPKDEKKGAAGTLASEKGGAFTAPPSPAINKDSVAIDVTQYPGRLVKDGIELVDSQLHKKGFTQVQDGVAKTKNDRETSFTIEPQITIREEEFYGWTSEADAATPWADEVPGSLIVYTSSCKEKVLGESFGWQVGKDVQEGKVVRVEKYEIEILTRTKKSIIIVPRTKEKKAVESSTGFTSPVLPPLTSAPKNGI
jgi:hypothetical protein